MSEVGIPVTLGSGVAAAGGYWRKTAAPLPGRAAAAGSPDAQAGARPAEAKAGRAKVGT